MGLHLENEVEVVKTPAIFSNNPVYSGISSALKEVEAFMKLGFSAEQMENGSVFIFLG